MGYRPKQPVPYSHKLHAGDLGIDCRYCHVGVEVGPKATVPPTQTCMNCHALIKTDSEKLQLVRDRWKSGFPMPWVRVHKTPDYAYFNHSAHVKVGVSCRSCHGRVDQMEEIMQVERLSMGWCLECHRDPAPHLRPVSEVTHLAWEPGPDQATFALQTMATRNITPPTDCSGCHR